MKELINNLIFRTGLSNKSFAEAVSTSASYLSQQKRQKNINHDLLIKWAKVFDIEEITGKTKTYEIKIIIK